MKKTCFILLVSAISMASCMKNQTKKSDKGNIPSLEPPKGVDNQWNKWLIGDWQGTAKSDFGGHKDWAKGACMMSFELTLNDQFLLSKGRSLITGLSDEYIKQLKIQKLSDSDIEKIRNSTFESMEIYGIDPKTGGIVGYLFDSLGCIAEGTGKQQDNKEIINWTWSGHGRGTSVRVTEKISEDKFVSTEKYSLLGGGIMEDKVEMTRLKPLTGGTE